MRGVAGSFEFGTQLSEGQRGVAWATDGIGGIQRRNEDDEPNVRDWRFVALVLMVRTEGELGMLDLSPGDLRFILASLASIWLCMEPPTAGLRRAAIESALTSCRRTAMKKWICT
jgi:hypothetical protein